MGQRQIGAVLKALVLEPENVEVDFVPLEQVFQLERLEPLGFLPVVLVRGVVARDESPRYSQCALSPAGGPSGACRCGRGLWRRNG